MKRRCVGTLVLALASTVLISTGCKNGKGTTKPTISKAPPASEGSLVGVVKETKDAGGYTYLRLDVNGKEEWAAVSMVRVKVGEEVTILGAMAMRDFESKALNRKFAKIYFGVVRGKGGGSALPAGHPPMPGQAANLPSGHPPLPGSEPRLPSGHPPLPGKDPSAGQQGKQGGAPTVDKPLPRAPGGKSVAEVHSQRSALSGKTVSIRGKVVKFTENVMGKNWIHLQDGTGKAETGDFDLTVTTKDTTRVGDIVVVKGTLRTDKDFGAGYRYGVIIEDAAIAGP